MKKTLIISDLEIDQDLSFLKNHSRIRALIIVHANNYKSIDGLKYCPNIEALYLQETFSKNINLQPLKQMAKLKSLTIKCKTNDYSVITDLKQLENLTIRSFPLENINVLDGLDRLRSLRLLLGGSPDFINFPILPKLKYLELWQIRNLRCLNTVNTLPELEMLF